jgi:hypothetical protein
VHRTRGLRLFGDDAAVLSIEDGRPAVSSCSREVRLWADSGDLLGMAGGVPLARYGSKHRYAVDDAAEDAVPVAAVLRLVDPNASPAGPRWGTTIARVLNHEGPLVPLSRAEGVVALRNGLMRLAPITGDEAAREFAFLVRWGAGVPMAVLRYTPSPEALRTAVEIVAALGAGTADGIA